MQKKDQNSAQKEVKNLSELTEKQAALLMLSNEGQSIPEIAKQLNMNSDYAYHIRKKLSKYKFTGNYKAQKHAFNTICSLSQGKTPKNSEIAEIKDSTALQAAKYISDHNDPVVQQVETKSISIKAVMNIDDLK